MGKLVKLTDRIKKFPQSIEDQFELSGYEGELINLVQKLTALNPADQAAHKKEQLRQSLLRERIELSFEELDQAAGGMKPPEPDLDPTKK